MQIWFEFRVSILQSKISREMGCWIPCQSKPSGSFHMEDATIKRSLCKSHFYHFGNIFTWLRPPEERFLNIPYCFGGVKKNSTFFFKSVVCSDYYQFICLPSFSSKNVCSIFNWNDPYKSASSWPFILNPSQNKRNHQALAKPWEQQFTRTLALFLLEFHSRMYVSRERSESWSRDRHILAIYQYTQIKNKSPDTSCTYHVTCNKSTRTKSRKLSEYHSKIWY